MFKNLSTIVVCHRMAAICQMSADEALPGVLHDQLQAASDKFRNEADILMLAELQQSSLWHLQCPTTKTIDIGALSLAHRIDRRGLKVVESSRKLCLLP